MVWPDYIGLDPAPARGLAQEVSGWSGSVDSALRVIEAAESLIGESVGVTTVLDDLGHDGRSMSAAINGAVDTVQSYVVPASSAPSTPSVTSVTSGASSWNAPAHSVGASWSAAMDGMVPSGNSTSTVHHPNSISVSTSTHHPAWQAAAQDGFVPGGPSQPPPARTFVLDLTEANDHIDGLAAEVARLAEGFAVAGADSDRLNQAFTELSSIGHQVTLDEASHLGVAAGTWISADIAATASEWNVDYEEAGLLHRRKQILAEQPTVELHRELTSIAAALTALHLANRRLEIDDEREADSPVDLQAAIDATMAQYAEPLGPVTELQIRAAQLDEAARWWQEADRLDAAAASIPDDWDYARDSTLAEAKQLRQNAWRQVEEAGLVPALAIGAMVSGSNGLGPAVSGRDLVRHSELERASALKAAADALVAPGLGFERDQMQREVAAILDRLFLSQQSRTVVAQYGHRLDPFETAALADYAGYAADAGAAVLDSSDPVRVLEVMSQGYAEVAALALVESSSSGPESMTFLELEARLEHLDANHGTNTAEYDATLRELSDRTVRQSGEPYSRANLDAARLAERAGASFADALAAVISARLAAIDGSPEDRSRQMDALHDDLVLLARVRNDEAHQVRVEAVGGSPANWESQQRSLEAALLAQSDPELMADRQLALLRSGAPLVVAEVLESRLSDDVSPSEAARIHRDIDQLVDDGADFAMAATAAIGSFELGVDMEVIHSLMDEGIDLPSAYQSALNAHVRGMTLDEWYAYEGFTDSATFSTIDGAITGDADGKVSIEDLDFVIASPDDQRFSAEIVAAAQAFRSSPGLMARLDTARDFSENVIDHQSFGRDRSDDQLWSREDLDAFEFKQNLNFVLRDQVDLIDTAGEGGTADRHLSRKDFEAVLDHADELGLSASEIGAITTVINGKLYDQNWLEANRDSLALAAAVVAGTAIFFTTGGAGAGLTLALVTSVASAAMGGAVAAGLATIGINAITDEDLDDGVVGNMIQGGLIGGMSALTLATGGAGWGNATLLHKGLQGVGLAAEAAGLVATGAADWAVDNPFYDGDSIDLANNRRQHARVQLSLSGGLVATNAAQVGGRRVAQSLDDLGAQQAATMAPPRIDLSAGGEMLDDALRIPPPRHARYPDGTHVLKVDRPPRLGAAVPDPVATGPHVRIRWDTANSRVYQVREFDVDGFPVRDIDFVENTFPSGRPRPGHTPPQQHRYMINNPTIGARSGFKRGPGELFEW